MDDYDPRDYFEDFDEEYADELELLREQGAQEDEEDMYSRYMCEWRQVRLC